MSALSIIGKGGEVTEVVDAPRLLAVCGIDDLAEADPLTLTTAAGVLGDLASITTEARNGVDRALVDYCDKRLAWSDAKAVKLANGATIHTTTPTAGTEVYDEDKLDELLYVLIAEGKLSQEAADTVRVPSVPSPKVTWDDLERIAQALAGKLDQPEHEDLSRHVALLLGGKPKPTYRTDLRGVASLRKLSPEVDERVDACKLAPKTVQRKATVSRKQIARAAA